MWIWGAAARNEIGKFATGGLPSETVIDNLGFKANAQLSQSNSAVASWNWSSKEVLGRDVGPTRQKETGWNQDGDTTILKVEDTHLFGASTVLTGSYSDVDIEFALAGASGVGPGAPEAVRNERGVWTGNFVTFATPRRAREAKIEGSYFFHGGALGHELKLGGRERKWEDENITLWPGRDIFHASGVNFGFPNGPTDVLMAHRSGRNPTTEEFRSLWAQDTLSGERWTLNVGLRYDLQDGENEPSSVPANPAFPQVLPALDFAGNDGGGFEWETWSPRLGVTYALGEDGRTLLRASLARYPEALGSGDILHVNPMAEASAFFRFTDGNGNNQWDGPQEPTSLPLSHRLRPGQPNGAQQPQRHRSWARSGRDRRARARHRACLAAGVRGGAPPDWATDLRHPGAADLRARCGGERPARDPRGLPPGASADRHSARRDAVRDAAVRSKAGPADHRRGPGHQRRPRGRVPGRRALGGQALQRPLDGPRLLPLRRHRVEHSGELLRVQRSDRRPYCASMRTTTASAPW